MDGGSDMVAMDTNTPVSSPAAAKDVCCLVDADHAALLDVRGFDEFAAGHATAAFCIPLPDIERRAAEIPTDRPVYVMCASGGRSELAVQRLRALGFDNVCDVAG